MEMGPKHIHIHAKHFERDFLGISHSLKQTNKQMHFSCLAGIQMWAIGVILKLT